MRKGLDKNVQRFLAFVRRSCKRNGVQLRLVNKPFIKEGQCNGYFDHNAKELVVATKKSYERWLKILVHEYAHLTQWVENTKVWKESEELGSVEEITGLWYDKLIELKPEQLSLWVNRSQALELDCEKRAVKLIRKHQLPLDIKEYIKQANAYVYFWRYSMISRKWYIPGKEPYNISELVEEMPEHFKNNYHRLSKKKEELYKKYC